jgi:glycosyltransferase involved in cell wall biosynthesis
MNPSDRRHPFLKYFDNKQVIVHSLFISSRAYIAECRFVRAMCHELRPSLVHTHGYRPDVLDAAVARGMGVPTVTTEHGASKMGGRTRVYEWLQNRSFRKFDAVVAVSRAIALELPQQGVNPDRIHLIQNAWTDTAPQLERAEARSFLGLPVDGFVVGWVGRLIPAKGCDVFLRSIAEIQEFPLQCSVIGDGPERRSLELLAKELGLDDRVSFLGQVEEAGSLFRAFDLFVLSSRTEGTPIVLFEAGSAGVPVVATRVGGVPDTFTDKEACLVASEDASSIACAIRRAYYDREAAQQRAENAKIRMAEHFEYDKWLARYEEVYRHVLELRNKDCRCG